MLDVELLLCQKPSSLTRAERARLKTPADRRARHGAARPQAGAGLDGPVAAGAGAGGGLGSRGDARRL